MDQNDTHALNIRQLAFCVLSRFLILFLYHGTLINFRFLFIRLLLPMNFLVPRRRRSPDSDHGRPPNQQQALDPAAAAKAAAKALSETKAKVERDVAAEVAKEVEARVQAEAEKEVAAYVATAEFRKMVEEMKRAERQRVLGEVRSSVSAEKVALDAESAARARHEAEVGAANAAAAAERERVTEEQRRVAEMAAAKAKAQADAARLLEVEARQREDDEREQKRLVRAFHLRKRRMKTVCVAICCNNDGALHASTRGGWPFFPSDIGYFFQCSFKRAFRCRCFSCPLVSSLLFSFFY